MAAHLIVMVHGLHGTYKDFEYLQKYVEQSVQYRVASKVVVLASKANLRFKTHAGLQVMSDLLYDEIMQFLTDKFQGAQEIYLTICGHSLGGLIGRFVAPRLLNNSVFVPHACLLICTPNLGCRKQPGTILGYGARFYLQNALGITGRQLYLQDDDALIQLSDLNGIYINALRKFKHRILIGNTQDLTVPVASSLMWPHHELHSAPGIVRDASFFVQSIELDSQSHDQYLSKFEQTYIYGVGVEYTHKTIVDAKQCSFRRYLIDFGIPENTYSLSVRLCRLCVHAYLIGNRVPIVERVFDYLCAGEVKQHLIRCGKQSSRIIGDMLLQLLEPFEE